MACLRDVLLVAMPSVAERCSPTRHFYAWWHVPVDASNGWHDTRLPNTTR